jgi:hypothetical protein
MKQIHYLHFGMPRSGTSWLFDQLVTHPAVDYTGVKEYPFLVNKGAPMSEYINYYNPFYVSLSMNPLNWAIDSQLLGKLDSFATHYSIGFRNPYTFLNSWFNFTDFKKHRPAFYVSEQLELNLVNYTKIIKRIKQYVHKPVPIMLYDDLVRSPASYLNTVTDHIGIPRHPAPTLIPINTSTEKQKLQFTDKEVIIINNLINNFSDYIDKDLTHWLR